ncbi:MAG: tetratricopeptide repeat protein [Bacteroidales bacterium]|nr:tetratricopeptide repeat protein [Bacteroidales bacterium]MCF8387346.1 tetratricopeptide repeat protein [Bacteroidales bacterium]MCF8396861.1 tetratricopeptide repeat protein [Bacteroidales bacterium]
MLVISSSTFSQALNTKLERKIDSIPLIKNDSNLLQHYLKICYAGIDDSLPVLNKYSQLAIGLARKLNEQKLLTEAYTCKGEYHYYNTEYDSATHYYQLALRQAKEQADSSYISTLCNYIAHARLELAEFREAIEWLQKCLAIDTLRKDSLSIANNFDLLGMCRENLNQYNLAIREYKRALNLFLLLNDSMSISNEYNNLGNVHSVYGNYEKALDYYLKALKIEIKLDNLPGLANVYNNIGIVYHDWKQYDKALEYYQKGYDLELKQNNPDGKASSLNNMAIIYDVKKNYDTALRLYKKALRIQHQNNNPLGEAITSGNIGEFLIERKKYDSAKSYLDRALEIYTKIDNKAGIGSTYSQYGILFTATRKYQKAIDYFNRSIAILQELKIPESQKENYKKISDLYNQIGNYEKAFHYLKKYQHLNDSIFSEQMRQKLSALQYDFELEQRESEIKLLNKENDMKELALEQQKRRTRLFTIAAIISFSGLLLIIIITILLIRQYRHKTAANKLLQEQKYKLEENRLELIQAKEKAEESDRLKTSFLANMSHEIRTPMNGILGFAELLTSEDTTKSERDYYINIISENSRQLIQILNDILDISLIETNQLKIQKRSVNLNKLLEEVYVLNKELQKKTEKEYIDFQLHLPESNAMVKAYTDPYRVEQVLNNLLSNAFKFTEQGKVELGMNVLNDEYEFYVKDTGIGISNEHMSKIFDRFRQLEDHHTRKHGGTGLGLTISKQLAHLLGGDLVVESKTGSGTEFRFTIPYYARPETDTGNSNFSFYHEKVNYPDLSDKTLLIAEDNQDNYRFISAVLQKTGCKLHHAQNGIECLEIFENNHVDLIIMDLQMPEMNGIDAAREIKKKDSNIEILALTAYVHLRNKDESIQELFSDYLFKPVSSKKLISVVSMVLNRY